MESSFSPTKKSKAKNRRRIITFLLIFVFAFVMIGAPIHSAKAIPVEDIPALVWGKVTEFLKKLWRKGASLAFQQVLRSALNKIAYDAANWIGSGAEGQGPLFVTQDWGEYLTQVGDEAAGEFLENFSQNLSESEWNSESDCMNKYSSCLDKCYKKTNKDPSDCAAKCASNYDGCMDTRESDYSPAFNVCQPSSLEAKLKISLGLADIKRSGAPNCTATQMVQNWGDAAQKYTDFKDPDFLNKFKHIFEPQSNDLGVYLLARTDMANKEAEVEAVTKVDLTANQGWLQKVGIGKNREDLPGQAERDAQQASDTYSRNFGQTTGDAFVDAANIFLNQLAMSGFNTFMQSLGKKTKDPGTSGGSSNSGSRETRYEDDPNVIFGDVALKEVTSSIIKPDFGVRTDYDILAELGICMDKNSPGPTHCVIDNKLMQGITEKKTVAEAIKDGYLHSDWQLTEDSQENTYSLRNVSIMRKYRILPVGWEIAIKKAYEDPENIKKITLMDAVSCFDPDDEYNQFSSEFDPRNQGWCQALVDPNWVLKAPLNYCKKQGVSAQILNKTVIPGQKDMQGSPDILSTLNITRAEDYCADGQTCIKEKDDGTCEVYGYCNEEKRIWKFGSDSCGPVYNTCQTFSNTSDGQTVSYLKNTLDYGDCNVDTSGCRQYSTLGSFDTSTYMVDWNENESLYFNKNIRGCSSGAEGCTELIRIKPAWGVNLVMDSDFSQEEIGDFSTGHHLNDWPFWSNGSNRKATIVSVAEELPRGNGVALKLEATGTPGAEFALGTFSDHESSLIPKDMELIPGQSYTLSADIYIAEGTKVHLVIGGDDYEIYKETREKNSWEHISITRKASNIFNELEFHIVGYSLTGDMVFYIKNVQLEMSDWDTGYNRYGLNRIYERLIPAYLEDVCYIDIDSGNKDYQLQADAPSQCYDYARRCNKNEVGCELYVSAKDTFAVPAQVTNSDYCPEECVGYDIYVSRETHFNSPQAENLLPNKTESCNIEAVGCNEFTNLDQLAQGGEKKEYYTALKHCVKPGQSSCSNFYAWEGTSNGYQLRVYTLKLGASGSPAVTSDDSELCNAEIYNLPINDPGYNSDCREFYNQTGQVFYHLNSRTITCSDNCHAYRMSEENIDKRLTYSECTGVDKYWDATTSFCHVCLNGGVWDDSHGACVYQAIPGEGKVCEAAVNGCREYNGNDGNNVKLLVNYSFESGTSGWSSNCMDGIDISSISNNKDGHSLLYNSDANNCIAVGEDGGGAATTKRNLIKKIFASDDVAAQLGVGGLITQGKAYTIKFIARAEVDTDLQIYFYNKGADEKAFFSPVKVAGGNDWQIYQANLENLDHAVDNTEKLIITANNDFYFDDFVLTEIIDRYYLIKGSSQIPDICYYDIFDNYQGADYNLGCSAYFDRDNLKHNLHQFSKLCSATAVGCEQMIDTKNYLPYVAGLWNDEDDSGYCEADEPDCVKVDGDSAIYAVYDVNKRCNQADLGCSLLGQGQSSGTSIAWSDVFKKNDPNSYDQVLCGLSDLGCEEWRNNDDNSFSYFKNPGDNVCIYRNSQDPAISGKNWYKIPVKHCDTNEDGEISSLESSREVCSDDSDCDGKPCIIDNNDYPCSTSYLKTIGLGGGGNQIPTPDQAVGLCESNASSCTEYIDPVSHFSANLVYNPSYELINGSREGWGPSGGETWNGQSIDSDQQVVKLRQNKLYILSSDSTISTNVRLDFVNIARELLSDNTFDDPVTYLQISGDNNHVLFNSLNNKKVLLTGGLANRTIELKEAIIGYQLQTNIDKKSCNGLVKFDNGCILFNERTIDGSNGLTNLEDGWDAYNSLDGQSPVVCDSSQDGSCTANQLIKVRPDRVCNTWFDCITYVQDPQTKERTCYAIGECDRLDDRNECSSFIESDSTAVLPLEGARNPNSSGYSLVNRYNLGQMKEVGLNSEVHYDFEDVVPPLSCERADNGGQCSFIENIVKDSLVREPEGAPTDYPAHGKSYLKVPASYQISPHSENVTLILVGETDYYINYLVNTKDSGLEAELEIESDNTSLSKTWSGTANNGWERRIHKFTTPASSAGVHIGIKLGSKDITSDGYVYFDDINIEPVLEIAPDEYIARECRLYPTADSLTCFNKNDNVINDGLEGYCLEHDPDNPEVCLLWYPVDKITSAKTGRSSLGYQGRFPLSYCAEVNGEFQLVEKRQAYLAGVQGCYDNCNKGPNYYSCYYATNNPVSEVQGWYYQQCAGSSGSGVISNPNMVKSFCGANAAGKYWLLMINHVCALWYHCMPAFNETPLFGFENPNPRTYSGNWCGNGGTLTIWPYEFWFPYDGFDGNEGLTTNNAQWYDGGLGNKTVKGFNEVNNGDPPLRVYDYHRPPVDEDDMKMIADDNEDEVFQLSCSRFIQVVDNDGVNKSWSGRVGVNSGWPIITPPYFIDDSIGVLEYYGKNPTYPGIHEIDRYGRNREEVPFGAAKWPDDFDLLSSEAIKLKNQYHNNDDDEIIAGRPYGCSIDSNNDNHPGCNNIGYCSLNPNVYCIYSDPNINSGSFNINKETCADGGFGTCVPLWSDSLGRSSSEFDFINILKTLFLKSYSSYSYDYVNNLYNPASEGIYDFSKGADRPGQCSGNIRPDDDYAVTANSESFCAVYPKIENTVLKYNNQVIDNTNPFYIPKKGIYQLEFNTEINVEQQPLKNIYIDWGDGSKQMITGQDYRPSLANPHIFYHYYKETGSHMIGNMVWDNWDYWGSCSAGTCTLPPYSTD